MTNSSEQEIIIYSTPTGKVSVEVIFNEETFWMTQKRIADLFGVEVPAISKHFINIYESGELSKMQLFPFWKQFKKKGQEM